MNCDKFKEDGFVPDTRPLCKGSYALGTACKNCSRCELEERLLFGGQLELQISPDSNVEKNRRMLLERSKLGLKKYGCTTEQLTLRESLQHALEEALDMANYLQQAISQIDGEMVEVIKATEDDVASEIEYRNKEGKVVGYWAYGSFDPSLPYKG